MVIKMHLLICMNIRIKPGVVVLCVIRFRVCLKCLHKINGLFPQKEGALDDHPPEGTRRLLSPIAPTIILTWECSGESATVGLLDLRPVWIEEIQWWILFWSGDEKKTWTHAMIDRQDRRWEKSETSGKFEILELTTASSQQRRDVKTPWTRCKVAGADPNATSESGSGWLAGRCLNNCKFETSSRATKPIIGFIIMILVLLDSFILVRIVSKPQCSRSERTGIHDAVYGTELRSRR